MTLINFTTTQISAFRIAFEAIESLISDVMFVFTKDDIRIKDIDKTGKLLISAKFEADKFDIYQYEHTSDKFKIGISTESIVKAIKSNLSYDVMSFSVCGLPASEYQVVMTLRSLSRDECKTCYLKKANVLASPDNIATMEYSAKCSMNPTLLSKYIKDLNHVSTSVSIGITDTEFVLTGIVDDKLESKIITTNKIKFGNTVSVERVDDEKPSKKIPITSLLLLNRCVNLNSVCDIYLSNELPLLISYPLSSMGEIKIVYL